MLKRNQTNIKFIFILSILFAAIGPVSSDLYLPSLPAIANKLHTTITLTQLSIAIFVFGFAIARLLYGLISDALGRRKPLLVGLFFCLVGSLICFEATNIYVLFVGRLLQGLGAGGSNLLARVFLRDCLEGKKLAEYNSYFSMAGITLMASAPFFGGYLHYYFGWRASFLVLSVYALVALVIGVVALPETNLHKHINFLKPKMLATNIKILFNNQSFLFYGLILLCAYGSMLAWLTAGPILLQKTLNLTSVEFGWLAGLVGFCYFSGAYINGRIIKKFSIHTMIRFGALCVFIAGLLMILLAIFGAFNIGVFIVPVMISIFGLSFITPNTYAAGMMPFPKMAGIAAAILGSMQVFGGFISSTIIAILHEDNQMPVGLVFLMAGLIIIVLVKKIRLNK